MSAETDRIRDMVMALSRGDHEEAQAAATEVMAAKTARITGGEDLKEMMNPMRQRRNAMGRKGKAARNMARGERGMRGRGRMNEEDDYIPNWDEENPYTWDVQPSDADDTLDPEYVAHVKSLGKVLRKDPRNSKEWGDKSWKMAEFLAKEYSIPADHAWRNLDNAYYGRPLWSVSTGRQKGEE